MRRPRANIKHTAVVCGTVVAAVFATAVSARAGEGDWRTLALNDTLSGGVHTLYATVLPDRVVATQGNLTLINDGDLIGQEDGRRVDFVFGGAVAFADQVELGVSVRGSATFFPDLETVDSFQSFGDTAWRIKWSPRVPGPFAVALIGGIDLLQGVGNTSNIADVATPVVGIAVSWLADAAADRPVPLRVHANFGYTYDRTVNLLDGRREPDPTERFAWQMFDDTFLWTSAAVEFPWRRWLPGVDGRVHLPVNDDDGIVSDAIVGTVTPYLKVMVIEALLVQVGVDGVIGDFDGRGPAVPEFRARVGMSYRFGEAAAVTQDRPPPDASPSVTPFDPFGENASGNDAPPPAAAFETLDEEPKDDGRPERAAAATAAVAQTSPTEVTGTPPAAVTTPPPPVTTIAAPAASTAPGAATAPLSPATGSAWAPITSPAADPVTEPSSDSADDPAWAPIGTPAFPAGASAPPADN